MLSIRSTEAIRTDEHFMANETIKDYIQTIVPNLYYGTA